MTEIQRAELKEYLETILDLYGEDEYEEFVEDIVYHYCERKFGVGREEFIIAPEHITQGSFVTYIKHPFKRQSLSVDAADVIAIISACAVGSFSCSF